MVGLDWMLLFAVVGVAACLAIIIMGALWVRDSFTNYLRRQTKSVYYEYETDFESRMLAHTEGVIRRRLSDHVYYYHLCGKGDS